MLVVRSSEMSLRRFGTVAGRQSSLLVSDVLSAMCGPVGLVCDWEVACEDPVLSLLFSLKISTMEACQTCIGV